MDPELCDDSSIDSVKAATYNGSSDTLDLETLLTESVGGTVLESSGYNEISSGNTESTDYYGVTEDGEHFCVETLKAGSSSVRSDCDVTP